MNDKKKNERFRNCSNYKLHAITKKKKIELFIISNTKR